MTPESQCLPPLSAEATPMPMDSVKGRAADAMVETYRKYYTSGLYDNRYPDVSPFALERVVKDLKGSTRILDFGCGTGRYLMRMLEHTDAELIGFDVCAIALEKLRKRLENHPQRHRVRLICGDFNECPDYDGAMSMFGVLSHIPTRAGRLASLRGIRQRLQVGGRFVASVPNGMRRYHKENFLRHIGLGPREFEGTPLEPNDIAYSRLTDDGARLDLYYHVYFGGTFRRDLSDAGFSVNKLEAESLLTETTISHSLRWAVVDDVARRMIPAMAGYGLYAVSSR